MMFGEKSMKSGVYTIVHEHFEEIFHQKAPKYGRSLLVLNSYSFFKRIMGVITMSLIPTAYAATATATSVSGAPHNPVMSTITMLLILGYSSGFYVATAN